MIKLDGQTIQQLYEFKIIDDRDLRRINIINSLLIGNPSQIISNRYNVSVQYINKLKKKLKLEVSKN